MKTLSYILGTEQEIEIGKELYFGQLWDGEDDGEELLESGAISICGDNEEFIVDFEVVSREDEIGNSIVKITDIR